MKQTVNISENNNLLKSTKELIERINEEIPMWKKSITEVPNAALATDISYHVASVPLLLRLSILDVCILFKLYLESNSVTEQNLLLRLLCGQLYEFSEDVPNLFGKSYRTLLKDFPNPKEIEQSLNQDVIKEFNNLKAKHRDFLKVIRHNVSHHKDIDALWQYHLINEIDFNWAIKACIDFVAWYAGNYHDFEEKLIEIAINNQNS